MKNQPKMTVIDIVNKINKIIDRDNEIGDISLMLEDLKISNFKIRAIEGEIDNILKTSPNFISTLWKINKIDQIVNNYFHKLQQQEKKLLLRYLKDLENRTINNLQNTLPSESLSQDKISKIVRLEIFKDAGKIN